MDKDIREVIYRKIDDRYSYGEYFDFKLIIDTKTGYVNASNLCKRGNKRYVDWSILDKSKEYITFVSNKEHIPENNLIHRVAGGNNTKIRGTYVHQKNNSTNSSMDLL